MGLGSSESHGSGKRPEESLESGYYGPRLAQPFGPPDPKPAIAPPRRRVIGNRDWIVPIECTGTGLTLFPARQKFALDGLKRDSETTEALIDSVRKMIERRQASVRQGESPYRPMIRFLVRPDGLESLHRAYPLLEPLRLPMHQVDLERDDVLDASIYQP
jgi:hypothetical protein